MIVNFKAKHKFKTILTLVRNLVPDFIFFFFCYCIYEKVPIQGKTQNTLYIS